MANTALKVTDINFDGIKNSLVDFLSSQKELQDYDFESSTVQTIINLLAYNTYQNSIYLNMVANEMFLDSAQIRNNVVSRAKQLGYIPRSARGAKAALQLTFTPNDSPDLITVPSETPFSTTIDGVSYDFITLDETSIPPNLSGEYIAEIQVSEGIRAQESYIVSNVDPIRYILNNQNADTSTLSVAVQESVSNTSLITYDLAANYSTVTGNSEVYFLQESEDQTFEVYFGDNITGKKPKDGNIVILRYNVVSGPNPNGANQFSPKSDIDGYNPIVTVLSSAQGGSNIEGIESIKLNAPTNYSAQNRAITANDYRGLLLGQFGDIQSVSVWGGEENDPPQYGRVFIAAKPTSGLLLSDDTKSNIIAYLADKKNLTVEPIVVNPTYLYIEPTIDVKYAPEQTLRTAGEISTLVRNRVLRYEDNNLGLFTRDFVRSELVKAIDGVEESITSVNVDFKLVQRFIPQVGVSTTYRFNFNHELLDISSGTQLTVTPSQHNGQGLTLSSTNFTFNGSTCQFDDDGFGNVRIFRFNQDGNRIYENRTAGTIDYNTGEVQLNSITIEDYADFISIKVVPREFDVSPIRSEILLFSNGTIRIYDTALKRFVSITTNVQFDGDDTPVEEYTSIYSNY